MLIDTHAHLHFDDYQSDIKEVLERAQKSGVTKIITVGTNPADSTKAVKLAAEHDQVYATVGLHPHDAKLGQPAIDQIKSLAMQPKVIAIGESGLDYYRNLSSQPEQERAFRQQIEMATEFGLPVVFHVRDAFSDFFKIMADYPKLKGVVHSFTGKGAEFEQIMRLGLLVAFNGIITFTKDQEQLAVAKEAPADSFVLETDCPFLAPLPNRGKRNEPAATREVAEFLAELRGESLAKTAQATTQNAIQLFSLD